MLIKILEFLLQSIKCILIYKNSFCCVIYYQILNILSNLSKNIKISLLLICLNSPILFIKIKNANQFFFGILYKSIFVVLSNKYL